MRKELDVGGKKREKADSKSARRTVDGLKTRDEKSRNTMSYLCFADIILPPFVHPHHLHLKPSKETVAKQ